MIMSTLMPMIVGARGGRFKKLVFVPGVGLTKGILVKSRPHLDRSSKSRSTLDQSSVDKSSLVKSILDRSIPYNSFDLLLKSTMKEAKPDIVLIVCRGFLLPIPLFFSSSTPVSISHKIPLSLSALSLFHHPPPSSSICPICPTLALSSIHPFLALHLASFAQWKRILGKITTASLFPITSASEVPPSLLAYLCAQFNLEIQKRDTYPMTTSFSVVDFGAYWFQAFGAVMLLSEFLASRLREELRDLEDHGGGWVKLCLGTFYIKPNYPGRSSHVCNRGFIVTDAARNRGVGRLKGQGYLEWAFLLSSFSYFGKENF